MTDRATCWSITINNPVETDYLRPLPAGWKLQGQIERGEGEGTLHYQGMLKTNQVRFSAVKKEFPRAHIEVARDKIALAKYVAKEETRVASVESIPTLFEYQTIIADKWVEDDFQRRWNEACSNAGLTVPDVDAVAMRYLDSLVEADIQIGRRGAEFIAVNPMWRSSWLRFWRAIINRSKRYKQDAAPSSCIESEGTPSSCSESSAGVFSEDRPPL